MDITIMLGNGFDVSLGIQSSYSSFYKWYCPQISKLSHVNDFRKNIDREIKSDIPDEEKTWADFEVGIGKYTENFTKETVNEFIDCFTDAQEKIIDYLAEQEEKFDLDTFYSKSFDDFLVSLRKFFDELPESENNQFTSCLKGYLTENIKISIVTFNYTNTLERILKRIPDSPLYTWRQGSNSYSYLLNRNIIHVHGTTNISPVLGVNDESQIVNKELLDTPLFKDFLIKENSIKALGHLWQSQAEKQISNSKFVCIMGMSLGPTDAKWWRKLCQWLKADNSRRIVLYWFEKNPPNKISYVRELQSKDMVKEKLLSYSNISESEKETLKNRIHIIINTDKFLKLVTEEQVVEDYQNALANAMIESSKN